jgi:glycosyltransferase involved in cell wall biosynthesis
MKIQIFTRNFLGKISNFEVDKLSAIGGAEVYLMQLIESIHQKYDDAKIEVYQVGDEDKVFSNEMFTIKYIKLNKLEKLIFPLVLSSKFKKYIDKDAIKIFNYPNYAAFVGKQDKSIGIFHGVEWDTSLFKYVYREAKYRNRNVLGVFPAILKYVYFRLIVPTLVKKGIDQIDSLVSVDNNIFNYIKSEKYTNKISVIYNCVDLDQFTDEIKVNNNSKTTILVPRNLNVARGVFLLPDVVTNLLNSTDDFIIKVVGTGPLKNYMESEVEKKGIQDNIELLGHISDRDEMVQLYQSSDIILIPTVFSEGTSLSALEALACNKPVIMTNIGGLKEIGIDGESKVTTNATPEEIAEKILAIMKDKDFAKKLQLNSRKCVEENHNYKDWSKKWLEIIDNYYA